MLPPVVVGAGVCGLAVGAALYREGHRPQVVDRAPAPNPDETAVLVGTNGVRVLDRLGLGDAVRSAGQPLERARILEANGRTLTTLSFTSFEGRLFDHTPVAIDRRALVEALRAALPDGAIEYGRECTGTAHQSGHEQVQFADGEAVQTSLVIGADGVRSAVRRSLFPDEAVRSTGWFRYRGVATESFEDHLRPEVWQVWGPSTLVRLAAIDADRVGWTITVDDKLGPDASGSVLAALSERCSGYPEPVRTLLARTDPDTVAVEPVLDLAPLDRWHGANIAVAGDAAHAAVPWLGYGRGLALVDAMTIAGRLRGVDSITGALEGYQADRKPTADWFTRRARQVLRVATVASPPVRSVRNRVVGWLPERATHPTRRRLAAVE